MRKTLIAVLCLLAAPAWGQVPKVVASIQPIHSLVAGVMEGVAVPELVVSGAASEHTYALKPSDARKLSGARLVVLVDPGYETFLAKPLAALAGKAETLAMAELEGMKTLPLRAGGPWDAHDPHDKGHDHHDGDGHVWLDPANAAVLVRAVAARLAVLDPEHAPAYGANAARLTARLDALDARLKATLAPVAGRPYVVFHDAYQYFEARYGLSPAGSIAVDPDRPPSARRLAALRDRLVGVRAACVFAEPQFPAPVAATLAQSAGAAQGVLDPQGADLAPGPDLYFTLMDRLAGSLVSCLSGR